VQPACVSDLALQYSKHLSLTICLLLPALTNSNKFVSERLHTALISPSPFSICSVLEILRSSASIQLPTIIIGRSIVAGFLEIFGDVQICVFRLRCQFFVMLFVFRWKQNRLVLCYHIICISIFWQNSFYVSSAVVTVDVGTLILVFLYKLWCRN